MGAHFWCSLSSHNFRFKHLQQQQKVPNNFFVHTTLWKQLVNPGSSHPLQSLCVVLEILPIAFLVLPCNELLPPRALFVPVSSSHRLPDNHPKKCPLPLGDCSSHFTVRAIEHLDFLTSIDFDYIVFVE